MVTVSGPALPVGRSLQLGIRVRQLPAERRLVLKTIQSYSDGKQDAWIELPTASVPEPDQPAPIVRLQPAAPGATAVPRSHTGPDHVRGRPHDVAAGGHPPYFGGCAGGRPGG